MDKTCNNCNYGCADDLADYTCVNSESDRCADWVGSDDTCAYWEPKESESKADKCSLCRKSGKRKVCIDKKAGITCEFYRGEQK